VQFYGSVSAFHNFFQSPLHLNKDCLSFKVALDEDKPKATFAIGGSSKAIEFEAAVAARK
jgi:hypothetical protein